MTAARRRRFEHAPRQAAALALLAVTLAGNFAAHHHSLLFSDDDSGRGEDRVVTRHNPLSHASHWHAVLAFVHEHECVACHNQRLPGLPIKGHEPLPSVSARCAPPIRPGLAPTEPLLSTASRAPPNLL